MADDEGVASAEPAVEQAFAPDSVIASLRDSGADRFDPVRFHFIEAMARRANQHQGEVKRILETRLAEALTAYRDAAASESAESAFDQENDDQLSPLAELARYIAQHSPGSGDADPGGNIGSRAELKTMRYFRSTWSKLSVEKQLTQAIEQGPQNAGPINSHQLVLRALALMRDISPDYLKHFMSYADALLWLDQAGSGTKVAKAGKGSKPAAKKATPGEGDKKKKPVRLRSR